MRTVQVKDQVESDTSGAFFGMCVDANDEEYETYKSIDEMTYVEKEKVAKRSGVSVEFLAALNDHLRELREVVHSDLTDLWVRGGSWA